MDWLNTATAWALEHWDSLVASAIALIALLVAYRTRNTQLHASIEVAYIPVSKARDAFVVENLGGSAAADVDLVYFLNGERIGAPSGFPTTLARLLPQGKAQVEFPPWAYVDYDVPTACEVSFRSCHRRLFGPEFGGSGGLVGGYWCVDLGFCVVRGRFRRLM